MSIVQSLLGSAGYVKKSDVVSKEELRRTFNDYSYQTMISHAFNNGMFSVPVTRERILIDKDGNYFARNSRNSDFSKSVQKGYRVFSARDDFPETKQDKKPSLNFNSRVHGHLEYDGKQIVALSQEDSRSVITSRGRVVAKFPEPVQPTILFLPSQEYVSLGADGETVFSTKGVIFPKFDEEVHSTLIYEGPGIFSALSLEDGRTVFQTTRNGYTSTTSIAGMFPREFKFLLGDDVQSDVATPIDIGGMNGRIVKIGKTYAGIADIENRTILHTDMKNNPYPYGLFLEDVIPETLTIDSNHILAIDEYSQMRIRGLYLGDVSSRDSTHVFKTPENLTSGIDLSKHVKMISGQRIEDLLK